MPGGIDQKLKNGTLENRDGRNAETDPPPEPLLDEFGDGFPLLSEDGEYLLPET